MFLNFSVANSSRNKIVFGGLYNNLKVCNDLRKDFYWYSHQVFLPIVIKWFLLMDYKDI